jgi:hypothetical protein
MRKAVTGIKTETAPGAEFPLRHCPTTPALEFTYGKLQGKGASLCRLTAHGSRLTAHGSRLTAHGSYYTQNRLACLLNNCFFCFRSAFLLLTTDFLSLKTAFFLFTSASPHQHLSPEIQAEADPYSVFTGKQKERFDFDEKSGNTVYCSLKIGWSTRSIAYK